MTPWSDYQAMTPPSQKKALSHKSVIFAASINFNPPHYSENKYLSLAVINCSYLQRLFLARFIGLILSF